MSVREMSAARAVVESRAKGGRVCFEHLKKQQKKPHEAVFLLPMMSALTVRQLKHKTSTLYDTLLHDYVCTCPTKLTCFLMQMLLIFNNHVFMATFIMLFNVIWL